MTDPNLPTEQEVQDCNDERESFGEPPVTAQDIQDVREQTSEE